MTLTCCVAQITANNLSQNYSLLTGAVVSLGMSLLLCVSISLIFPAKQRFRQGLQHAEV